MRIVSGIPHIQHGILKARVDIYPDRTCLNYARCIVDAQDDYGNLLGYKQLNPLHSHFIKVGETTALQDLNDYLERFLTPADLKTLDANLALPDRLHRINPFMKERTVLDKTPVATRDIKDLIASAKMRFAPLDLKTTLDGERLILPTRSIDIGADATDRANIARIDQTTYLDNTNVANASGTLEAYSAWVDAACADPYFNTWYVNGGNHKCRDTEQIGVIEIGTPSTGSGLDIAVETDDKIGCTDPTDLYAIISTDTNYGDLLYKSGHYYTVGDDQTFGVTSGPLSLKLTGTESGGGLGIPIAMHLRKMMEAG